MAERQNIQFILRHTVCIKTTSVAARTINLLRRLFKFVELFFPFRKMDPSNSLVARGTSSSNMPIPMTADIFQHFDEKDIPSEKDQTANVRTIPLDSMDYIEYDELKTEEYCHSLITNPDIKVSLTITYKNYDTVVPKIARYLDNIAWITIDTYFKCKIYSELRWT
jgi:hypothetical protein